LNRYWQLATSSPRAVFAALSLACIGMLSFGLYLQHVVGLNPCPMCIVQRYCVVLILLVSALSAAFGKKASVQVTGLVLVILLAIGGAFVAARQSWLQWYPPEIAQCGRDFYGMIETFPLQRVIPMIFRGSGDCTKIDWTFLGGSLANWVFVTLTGVALLCLALLVARFKARR